MHVLEENYNFDLDSFSNISPKPYGVSAHVPDYNSEPH